MAAGAAMATAASREKRAMMIFILQGLEQRLESSGDREVTLTKCDEDFDCRKYPELGKEGLTPLRWEPLCICLPLVLKCHIVQPRSSSICREWHELLTRNQA